MQIHQVLASAAPGDAVTTAALELRELLRRLGPSDIYARYVHAGLDDQVFELKEYRRGGSSTPARDVLIYHASIGEPLVHQFLIERPERLVVYYHNISPAGPFYPYDPTLAGLLQAGRQEVADLARRADLALAVSGYNAAELVEMGYGRVEIAPLVLDLDRLAPDPVVDYPSRRRLASADGPVILFVGQLLPHKRPDFLLGMFHVRPLIHRAFGILQLESRCSGPDPGGIRADAVGRARDADLAAGDQAAHECGRGAGGFGGLRGHGYLFPRIPA